MTNIEAATEILLSALGSTALRQWALDTIVESSANKQGQTFYGHFFSSEQIARLQQEQGKISRIKMMRTIYPGMSLQTAVEVEREFAGFYAIKN